MLYVRGINVKFTVTKTLSSAPSDSLDASLLPKSRRCGSRSDCVRSVTEFSSARGNRSSLNNRRHCRENKRLSASVLTSAAFVCYLFLPGLTFFFFSSQSIGLCSHCRPACSKQSLLIASSFDSVDFNWLITWF